MPAPVRATSIIRIEHLPRQKPSGRSVPKHCPTWWECFRPEKLSWENSTGNWGVIWSLELTEYFPHGKSKGGELLDSKFWVRPQRQHSRRFFGCSKAILAEWISGFCSRRSARAASWRLLCSNAPFPISQETVRTNAGGRKTIFTHSGWPVI